MKLTEIAIDGYRGTRNTHLQNLSSGLNVVFNSHSTVRQSICNFIVDTFFGPGGPANPTIDRPCGYVHVQSGGHHYRLARDHASEFGEIAVSDLAGSRISHRTPELLSSLDHGTYNTFFNVTLHGSAWNSQDFLEALFSVFELSRKLPPGNMPFSPDLESFTAWRSVAESRIPRLETIHREMESLHTERARLATENEHYHRNYRERLAVIDRELNDWQSRFDLLSAALQNEHGQLAELDRKIEELNRHIEREENNLQHIPVTRPQTDYLTLYYDRLDEIDNQIRRWRSVQSDIQNQRIRLRDDMVSHNELGIESHEHPYHDTREIVTALGAKVNRAEELARSRDLSSTPVENTRQMTSLCKEMRNDLQALCTELGQQYKHVRHKAAVAELKQLRRCYHEMDENVKRLLVRRESVIDEIRRLDPAGAEAILQANQQFTLCAEQEGYLAARQKLLTAAPVAPPQAVEYRTVYPDLGNEKSQLVDYQTRRRVFADQIANLESERHLLEQSRSSLIDERNRLTHLGTADHEDRLSEVKSALALLDSERQSLQTQIEFDRPWFQWKPDYLLADASRYLHQLTDGRLTQVWLEGRSIVMAKLQDGSSCSMNSLPGTDQSMVRTGLSLAAIDQFALRGIRLPVLVEDHDQVSTTQGVIPTLASFCRNGHQVMLLSADRSLMGEARNHQAIVFDLPDTNITSPAWSPETPALPRHDFRQDPAPPAGRTPLQRTPLENLPVPSPGSHELPGDIQPVRQVNTASWVATPVVVAPRAICSRDTMLQDIDLVESIYLTPIESLGIRTVGQLLDLDLNQHEADLTRRGFIPDQIDRWQSQAWLLICMPEITTSDARVLVGSGLDRPELIVQISETEILERIQRFMDSPSGRRSNVGNSRFNTERIRTWADQLRVRSDWRGGYQGSLQRKRTARTQLAGQPSSSANSPATGHSPTIGSPSANPSPASGSSRSTKPRVPRNKLARDKKPSREKSDDGYQFFLNSTDDIELAPSIGPKTAERFHDIGIRNIDDFLNGDVADMASRIDNRRMSAKVIGSWQTQAALMCALPNLRGHDVQILVGCGILDPQELAKSEPRQLLETVTRFVATREGARALRNARKPDLDEVTYWIDAANHARTLNAA